MFLQVGMSMRLEPTRMSLAS